MDMVYIPIFILIFFTSLCQSNDKLTQEIPLFLKDKLVSEGGDFALGFFSPANSSRKLYIGIWYNSIPERERTVVWVANRDSPITDPSSAKLSITNNSELVLSDSQGRSIWKTNNTREGAGAFAVILNSGNFVLRLPNGTDIWQSFDHPTDTMLPTMRLILSFKAQLAATRFFAWTGPDDPSSGDFSLGMDPTSNLQIFIWNGTLPYFRNSVLDGISLIGGTYQSNNGSSIVIHEEIINTRDELYYKYTVSPGSPYMRLSLDYTGKVRFLSWSSTTSSWAVISELPNAYCDPYASCGPFSYCDHTEAIPTCRCPDEFELVDMLNFSRGCRRKEALKCGKDKYFTIMPNMKVPDKFLHIRNRSFDQCTDECTRNCSCIAYAYANLSNAGTMGDTTRCLVWTGDLTDMEKIRLAENLYIRHGQSAGRHVPYTSSSHLSFPASELEATACL